MGESDLFIEKKIARWHREGAMLPDETGKHIGYPRSNTPELDLRNLSHTAEAKVVGLSSFINSGC